MFEIKNPFYNQDDIFAEQFDGVNSPEQYCAPDVDLSYHLWHNPRIHLKLIKAVMETSKAELVCQRIRKWCKPDQFNRLKILPEL